MTKPATMRLSAELENLSSLRRFVEEVASQGDGHPRAIADMVLAADEAATNVILHGYRGQPGYLEVEVGYEQDALVVRLRDRAPAFDPGQVPGPDLTAPLERRRLGGLGVYLMHALTDDLLYHCTPQGENELTLIRRGARGPVDEEGEYDSCCSRRR